jgi:hypothetical protein
MSGPTPPPGPLPEPEKGRKAHGRPSVGLELVLTLLLLLPASAVAQQQDKQPFTLPRADGGTQLFRGLLDFHKIQPETLENTLKPGYDFSKLIVITLDHPGHQNALRAKRFALANGGAVLIASSNELDLVQLLGLQHVAQARITGDQIGFRTSQPGQLLQWVSRGTVKAKEPSGVFDRGMDIAGRDRPELTLFGGYQNVEVNTPSRLSIAANSRPPQLARDIAVLPANAVHTANAESMSDSVFAAAGVGDARNPFRCVAVADTDIFSNMLLYASGRVQNPNDNLKFANNLVQWLKGPQGRTHCLFIENGRVIDKFDEVKYAALTGPNAPMPPVPTIDPFDPQFQQRVTDFANDGVARVQDDDRLVGPLTDTPQKKAVVYAALAVVVAVIAYLLLRFRSLAGRFRAVFRPLPKDPHMLGPDAAVGSLEHRRLELLRSGNYAAPVRSYVRQLFEDRGLPPGYDHPKLPPIDFDVRNPDYLRRSVRTLWAEVQSAAPVNYGRWKELEPMLAALRAAADDDRWRFAPGEYRWRFAPGDEGDA